MFFTVFLPSCERVCLSLRSIRFLFFFFIQHAFIYIIPLSLHQSVSRFTNAVPSLLDALFVLCIMRSEKHKSFFLSQGRFLTSLNLFLFPAN